jgi:hypothetical protein
MTESSLLMIFISALGFLVILGVIAKASSSCDEASRYGNLERAGHRRGRLS